MTDKQKADRYDLIEAINWVTVAGLEALIDLHGETVRVNRRLANQDKVAALITSVINGDFDNLNWREVIDE